MHDFNEDLRDLEKLYLAMECHLEKQYQELLACRFPDSDERREAAAWECRLLEAEKQLANLSSSAALNESASQSECTITGVSVAALKERAQHLLNLLGRNAARCVQIRNAAETGLQELRRGERFLQGMRGYRENQPKFLDSCQ